MIYSNNINDCFGKYVKYDTYIGKHLTDYYEINHHIKTLRELLSFYDKKYREFYKYLEENPDPHKQLGDLIIPLESVLVNIVTTYTRCFDTSKTQEGKKSRRLIKLNKTFLKNISPELVEFHDQMFEIRNKRVSHAGVTPLEKYEFNVGVTKEGQIHIRPGDDNFRAFVTDEIDFSKANLLLDEIVKRINNKIDSLLTDGYEEVQILARNRSLFIDRLANDEPITQEDIRKSR